MVPKTLRDWTEASIRRLLENQVFEGDSFDWKEALPKKAGPEGRAEYDVQRDRTRTACAAFANSPGGGFLVYGVRDSPALDVEARLVGIDPAQSDFLGQFGTYASSVRPAVRWESREAPILLPNGRLIQVIWIPPSRTGPHAVPHERCAEALLFPKRVTSKTSYMSYEEIRMAFYGYHEKLDHLNALRLELAGVRDDMHLVVERMVDDMSGLPATELGVEVLERLVSDNYALLVEDLALFKDLGLVRRRSREFNVVHHQARRLVSFQSPKSVDAADARAELLRTARDLHLICNSTLAKLEAFLKTRGIVFPALVELSHADVHRAAMSGNIRR